MPPPDFTIHWPLLLVSISSAFDNLHPTENSHHLLPASQLFHQLNKPKQHRPDSGASPRQGQVILLEVTNELLGCATQARMGDVH